MKAKTEKNYRQDRSNYTLKINKKYNNCHSCYRSNNEHNLKKSLTIRYIKIQKKDSTQKNLSRTFSEKQTVWKSIG